MNLVDIPNPKRLSPRRDDCYPYYAGFSSLFAKSMLGAMGLNSGDIVVDPWNGSGTTTWAAHLSGCRSAGFDLNPVMVEIGRGRALSGCRLKAARQAARRVSAVVPVGRRNDPLLVWFAPIAAQTIRGLADSCKSELDPALRGFLLTALFNTVRSLTRQLPSANPTWMKRPLGGGLRVPTAEVVSRFETAVERFLDRPPVEWPDCGTDEPMIDVADAACIPLEDASAAAVFPSPPYCTRIDYAQNTQIELAVLGLSPIEIAQLRGWLTGTTTIRAHPEMVIEDWGASCLRLLNAVKLHPSKSSANYYWKNLTQYFGDLYRGIREAARYLRPDGIAIFVVQDSRYKELHIDLARIVTEMAEPFGWMALRRQDYSTRRTIRSVNTRSRMYHTGVDCIESVLWFEARS